MSDEISQKIELVREELKRAGLEAARFRGVDWFGWASGGGDNSVIFSSESGVAEVLITQQSAFVLTNEIERPRMLAEVLAAGKFEVPSFPWAHPEKLGDFVQREARRVASDRPAPGESPLPDSFRRLKWELLDEEVNRYRALGKDAAEAMREALSEAHPDCTEQDLAGLAARALWRRGIHPLLTLVAGEKRLPVHRHPVATSERLGGRAMLVFCGRRHGLFANFTRHVFFRTPTEQEWARAHDCAKVEAAAFRATQEGLDLPEVYHLLNEAYEDLGYASEIERHHQGGPCGYLSREAVARPGLVGWARPERAAAYAWNPSMAGTKIEDTILRHADGRLELLTLGDWPCETVDGRQRPLYWVRA